MIKSQINTNNSYRIVKVLTSQDYLATDKMNISYILCQHMNCSKNVHCLKTNKKLEELEIQQSRVVREKQQVTIDHIAYSLFDVGMAQLMWVKDVPLKLLQSQNFIIRVMKQAVQNILEKLLWIPPSSAISILHINNFWLVDGNLTLLSMHRPSHCLRKTQSKRSYSQETSAISIIIGKQMTVIKNLALILWQILQQKPYSPISRAPLTPINQLLVKMITKEISFSEIIVEVKNLSSTLITSRIRGLNSQKTFRQDFLKKRFSEPSSLSIKKTKRKSFSLLQPTIKTRSKTEFHRELTNLSTIQSNDSKSSNLLEPNRKQSVKYNHQHSNMSFKPRYTFSTSKKVSLTRIVSESQKNKYLNWVKNQKVSSTAPKKMMDLKLLQKPKENSQIESQSKFQDRQKQMKQRLLNKVQKYRQLRFCKQVHTQTSNSHQFVKDSEKLIDSRINKNIKQSIPDEQIVLKTQSIIKQTKVVHLSDCQQPDSQSKNLLSSAKKDFKIETNEGFSKNNQQNTIWKEAITIIDPDILEEVQLVKKQNKVDSSRIRVDKQSTNNQRQNQLPHASTVVVSLKLKEASLKSKKHIFEDVETDELQTITFGVDKAIQNKNQGTNSKKQQRQSYKDKEVEQKNRQQIQNKNLKNQSKKVNPPQNPSLNNEQQDQIVNDFQLLVSQYANMINILADISIFCVKNKLKLKKYQWRTSVYFIYQRFYQQRIDLLNNIKNGHFSKIIRISHQLHPRVNQLWGKSQYRKQSMSQIQKENVDISLTYQRLAKKTLEECKLQPYVSRFIRNRQQILTKNKQNVRYFLSKYAIAFIINQFDEALEKKEFNQEEVTYLLKCIFGLRIMAQLDGKEQKSKILVLSDYNNKLTTLRRQSAMVQHLYGLYYPRQVMNICYKYKFQMERHSDRNAKCKQKRKFKFFTDPESQELPSSSSDPNEPKDIHPNIKIKNQSRNVGKLRQIIRRNYQFLTETEYSNPYYSEYEVESQSPKREKSPLPQDSYAPHKKIKGDESKQIDIQQIVEQGFDFLQRIRSTLSNNKK